MARILQGAVCAQAGVHLLLLLATSSVAAETAANSYPCSGEYLTAATRQSDECAGIFTPRGTGTLKNNADTLNGRNDSGIGPLWGGGWAEVAVFEDGHGSGLGFHIDEHEHSWSLTDPLSGDFVIGIKQSTEVAFYLFAGREGVTGGRFAIDPNFHGEGFSNARIYTHHEVSHDSKLTLAKSIGEAVSLGGRDFSVPVVLTVSNLGSDNIQSLQITDNLDIFGTDGSLIGTSDFAVGSASEASLSLNGGFDGLTDRALLAGTDTLPSGASASLSFTLSFTCTGESTLLRNVASAAGIGHESHLPVGAQASADFHCPADSPAPHRPGIELAKHIGEAVPIGPGQFSVPVSLSISNTGNEALNDVQIEDKLDIFVADSSLIGVNRLSSERLDINPGYDGLTDISLLTGSGVLPPKTSASVTFDLQFACRHESGPFVNVAVAGGTGAESHTAVAAHASAEFQCPAEPAEPPEPAIELIKRAGEVATMAPGEFAVPITLEVNNVGSERLSQLRLADSLAIFEPGGELLGISDLASATLGINGSFDGRGDTELLRGEDSLAPGASGTVTFSLHFSCVAGSGPFENKAEANALGAKSGLAVADHASAEFHCPAEPAEPPEPAIELAVQAGSVTSNGSGQYTVPITLTVTNSGDDPLLSLQIVDPLAIFGGGAVVGVTGLTSAALSLNPAYDGTTQTALLTGTDGLAVGASGTVSFDLTFAPGSEPGPFTNIATTTATGEVSGEPVSNTGEAMIVLPPPPPPPPPPTAAVELTMQAGAATASGSGQYTVAITLTATNGGDDPLLSLQLDDPLSIFGSGTVVAVSGLTGSSLSVNPAYDGTTQTALLTGSDGLAVGASATVTFDLRFAPGSEPGPFANVATATATGEDSAQLVSDTAEADIVLPSPPPPPVTSAVELTKQAGSVVATGSGQFSVPITLAVTNTGDDALLGLQLVDPLAIFGSGTVVGVSGLTSGSLTVNPAYDGSTQSALLTGTDGLPAGATGTVSFDLRFAPGTEPGPFVNVATATARGADTGQPVSATNEVSIELPPPPPPPVTSAVELTKQAGPAVPGGGGSYAVPITLTVTNSGADALLDLTVEDPLDIFGGGTVLGVTALAGSGGLSIDSSYDGTTQPRLLTGTDALAVGATGTVSFELSFAPGTEPGPFLNVATATAMGEQSGQTVSAAGEASIVLPAMPLGTSAISGSFYDSRARSPVTGAAAALASAGGSPLPDACLAPQQQGQVVGSDGNYRFDLNFGADPACPAAATTYRLVVVSPSGYLDLPSRQIAPEAGALRVSSCVIDPDPAPPCEVQSQGAAPQSGDATRYYLELILAGNDQNVVNNHLPLDADADGGGSGDATAITVAKVGDRETVARGEAVGYEVQLVNTSDLFIAGVALVDDLPAGFQLIAGSARLVRAGPDDRLDTADDLIAPLTAAGTGPVSFGPFDLGPGASAVIRYATRVGTGVANGEHTNCAWAEVDGDRSNTSCWTVRLAADPVFERTTVIGKVFHDLNRNGRQDVAAATGITVTGGPFGCLLLGDLPARLDSAAPLPRLSTAAIPDGQPAAGDGPCGDDDASGRERVEVRTREGGRVRFTYDADDPSGSLRIVDGTAPQVHGLTSGSLTVNPDFDTVTNRALLSGVDSLAPGEIASLTYAVEFAPGTVLDPLLDTVTASASGQLSGEQVRHTAGTPLAPRRPGADPAIALKRIPGRPTLHDGSFTLPVTLEVENVGDEALVDLQLDADLAIFARSQPIAVTIRRDGGQIAGLDIVNYGPEAGIPGVRLATVTGLTVETDAEGRFHLADVDAGRFERGGNFIMKLDTDTLPSGAEVISENPRVLRLTEALMSRINFAVALDVGLEPRPRPLICTEECETLTTRRVTGRVSPVLFDFASMEIPDEFEDELASLLDEYHDKPKVRLAFVGHADRLRVKPGGELALALGADGERGNEILSERRALRVCTYVRDELDFDVDCNRVEGRGSREPAVPEDTPAARAQNRRVEIELLYDEVERTRTTRRMSAEACLASRNDGAEPSLLIGSWLPEANPECTVSVAPSADLSPVATGITVSGGPFGCNASPDWGDNALQGRDAAAGPGDSAANTLTVVARGSGSPGADCGHGIRAGEFPIEVRTNEGSVHHINRAGDVLRVQYPSRSRQWIVVTPFRDNTDNTTIAALRISNLGVPQSTEVLASQRATASVWFTSDPGVLDPRLDVLALDQGLMNGRDGLRDPIRFAAYTNYAAFIGAYRLEIYGRSGARRKLLRKFELEDIGFGADIRFDGRNEHGRAIDLTRYEQLEYVLKAFECADRSNGRGCRVDATRPRLVGLLQAEAAAAQATHEPEELWGMSNLAEQHIPISGNRVRFYGADFAANAPVTISERAEAEGSDAPFLLDQGSGPARKQFLVPVGRDGRFVLEQHLPPGDHAFSVVTHVRDASLVNSRSLSATATVIEVSGGAFGCRQLVAPELPGRGEDGSPLDTPAVTAVGQPAAEPAGECQGQPGIAPGRYPLQVETAEHTVLWISRAGDVIRISEPEASNQRIVVTPFRDETDSTVISALRISNEGVDPSFIDMHADLDVDVAGDDRFFFVALTNLTIGRNDVSGNIEPLSADDHFDGSLFTDGRVAVYAKGKIQGKYLLTAQLDSTEDELANLGDNLRREDPRRIFRQLDPNRYYPVYGDDSTTTSDVDTQGALYLRLDWDHNTALFGNYNTGMTDTELMQYNRSLYGATVRLETSDTNKYGDARGELKLFGSQAQSVPAHVTFEATGGSLYYLRHTDIVQGSEKAWIEVRRRDTQQVLEREVLLEGRDYEIDALQGRIILRRPLSLVVNDRGPAIIRSRPLEGDDVFLLVDYEYVPRGFSADNLTSGGRGKQWLGDHVALGATRVTDERNGLDYGLEGLDLTVKGGQGTYLTAEAARSEATQSDVNLVSSDGGLTFRSQSLIVDPDAVDGDALAIEGRIDLSEIGDNRDLNLPDGDILAWRKRRDGSFSTGRLDDGIETTDSGLEVNLSAGEKLSVTAGLTSLERELVSVERTARVQAEGKFGRRDRTSAGLEIRREEIERLAPDPANRVLGLTSAGNEGDATLVGLRLGHELSDDTTIYAAAQTATEQSGAYADNDLVSVGVKTRLNDTVAVSLEASDGDRGSALTTGVDFSALHGLNLSLSGGLGSGAISQFSTSYSVAEGHELYGSYAVDPDRTEGERNLLTLGQRRDLGNHLGIFTESQFGDEDRYSSVAHVFGLDFDGIEDWRIRGSLQFGDSDDGAAPFERRAASVGAYLQTQDLKFSSRLEYREDEGAGLHTRQYVTSNSFTRLINENRRWLGNLNVSWADDAQNGGREAGFAELDIGHAYRPVANDRLNLIAKYSYLYDLPTEGQASTRPDERSHLVSIDAIYDLGGRWELGGKLAFKEGERRGTRGSGPWQEFGLRLTTVRARYHVNKTWDALAEYRWLSDVDGDSTREGVLLGLYRSLGDRFKAGVGYNFTDFDDDLRNDGYDNRGWFLDFVGKY